MSHSGSIENVSDTALWVAIARAAENDRPDALYRDPLTLRLAGERGREIARSMPYGKILNWIMAMRTYAIDKLVLHAVGAGAKAVVNIGTGLDTRPYRMELPADLQWVEIDVPHIIALKNKELRDEKPRCKLTRFAADFSDVAACRALYARIGSEYGPAVIITEGVLPYLTDAQTAELAENLHAVPSFRFWIQDYREGGYANNMPPGYKRMLKNAPFRSTIKDWFGFARDHGWNLREKIIAFDQGLELARPFPIPFPWKHFLWLIPHKKREEFRKGSGYSLLERK